MNCIDSNSPRRVALFVPSLGVGGAERVILTLSDALVRQGYMVDLLVATNLGNTQCSTTGKARVICFGASRPLWAIRKLAAYLRREKPAAMLSTITSANIAALLARRLSGRNVPCVVREATTLSSLLVASAPHNKVLTPVFVRRLYRQAFAVVAVSKGVADDLVNVIGVKHPLVRVIYNPVLSDRIKELSNEQPLHPWFQEDSIPILIGAGRLSPEKDFATLIRAFALVRQRVNARLLILGDGPERQSLERLAIALGVGETMNIIGFVNNPYAYLSRAKVFALSSRREGLPNVLVEALACGAAVVSTDCRSGPEEILSGGEYGQLVPVGNTDALATAIVGALRGVVVSRNPSEHLALFDLDKNCQCYCELLSNAASAHYA